jgi:peptide/nickel transport system permease protein
LWPYIARRVGLFLLTVLAALTLNFVIIHLTPADPVAALLGRLESRGATVEGGQQLVELYRQQFALDQPIWVQYFLYLKNLIINQDLGYSLAYFPVKVNDVILGAVPWTLGLLLTATVLAFSVGNVLGALAVWPSVPRGVKWAIYSSMSLAAIPFYLLALILLYLFAFRWNLLPIGGTFTPGSARGFGLDTLLDLLRHALLPVMSLALGLIGFWALSMRGVMASLLGDDYLRYARAKGLKERTIFFKYGMRNAMLPQVTYLAIDLGRLISGQVLVETIFNYPGLGTVLFKALGSGDYFVVQGVVLFIIMSTALATLLLDIVYPLLDPRVRRGAAAR